MPDDFQDPRYIAYQGDINDNALMEQIFTKYPIKAVFHCAALLAHVKKDLPRLNRANIDGTRKVRDFCLRFGVQKLIFISSNCLWAKNFEYPVTEAEPPAPIEIYGKSKLAGEQILLSQPDQLTTIIFRCPTIMDEGRLGLLAILYEFIAEERKIPIVGNGNNRYQFIYAQDLARACELALNYKQCEIFNIGADQTQTFNQVYQYVIDHSGSHSTLLHLPRAPMLLAMRLCFWLGLSPLGPYQYKMISSSFVFDTTKIKTKLGFTPTLRNEEMLLRAYQYFIAHRQEIMQRKNVSAHNSAAKMGAIRLLKWLM